ncbi:molybdenum cofactor biosynthesis F family protein [Aspergillus stella-maris]|uniref:molybdenum cofactor biosynthesis F family protein n=1 Tax=Aspergillus stella-maris TaxID=1810926 RepID=UPI003CCCAB1E
MTTTTETPGYVPVSEWPNLEALAVGYHEHLMPSSDKLKGKDLTLVFADPDDKVPKHITHNFDNTNDTLRWEVQETKTNGTATYKAFEVRSDIFLVDFYKSEYEEQVTIVMNLRTGQAIVGLSGFSSENQTGKRRTWTQFSHASIDGFNSDNVVPFAPTTDLIGKHILYRYTPRDAYEHVYLNPGTFTWHCLSGTEKGLADTEPCKMLKIDEKLYLLFWSEKIMPVESIVVVDLEGMRSTGRFFCWDPKPDRMVQMVFGSFARVLAETDAAGVIGQGRDIL